MHPDANDDTKIEWSESKLGNAIIVTGSGKARIEVRMLWDAGRK